MSGNYLFKFLSFKGYNIIAPFPPAFPFLQGLPTYSILNDHLTFGSDIYFLKFLLPCDTGYWVVTIKNLHTGENILHSPLGYLLYPSVDFLLTGSKPSSILVSLPSSSQRKRNGCLLFSWCYCHPETLHLIFLWGSRLLWSLTFFCLALASIYPSIYPLSIYLFLLECMLHKVFRQCYGTNHLPQ